MFGVPTETLFSNYLRAFRVVACTVEKGGPLARCVEIAFEAIWIRTAQQYPMLMPTLFPGHLATREQPYDNVALMWPPSVIRGTILAEVCVLSYSITGLLPSRLVSGEQSGH